MGVVALPKVGEDVGVFGLPKDSFTDTTDTTERLLRGLQTDIRGDAWLGGSA